MTANSNLVHPDEPSIWGMDTQLAQFEAVLMRNRPALILVTGKPGSGKSSFLRETGTQARKQGWKTAQSGLQGDLQVRPETTEEDFSKHVLQLLGVSETQAEIRRRFGVSERLPVTPPVVPPLMPPTSAAEAGARGVTVSAPPAEFRQATSEDALLRLHPLAARLSRLAQSSGESGSPRGVLLLIDGYRPDPEFAAWFASVLLRDLAYAGAPVAITVADQIENLQEIKPLADQLISSDSLDPEDLQRRFEAIGREVTPPIESTELAHYVEEALKRPQIIGPLRRVLGLARQPA